RVRGSTAKQDLTALARSPFQDFFRHGLVAAGVQSATGIRRNTQGLQFRGGTAEKVGNIAAEGPQTPLSYQPDPGNERQLQSIAQPFLVLLHMCPQRCLELRLAGSCLSA